MHDLLRLLDERAGQYAGEGMSEDGAILRGKLGIVPLQEGGFLLRYIALGLDGAPRHREQSALKVAPDGELLLLVESMAQPGMREHRFHREEAADGSFRAFVFGYGEPLDRDAFRQEIAIDIWSDGDVGYRHAWGLPGEELASRAGVRMQRVG